nr:hypothetical protein L204_05163 [Cryptococcus depauperatus CBS 7855]
MSAAPEYFVWDALSWSGVLAAGWRVGVLAYAWVYMRGPVYARAPARSHTYTRTPTVAASPTTAEKTMTGKWKSPRSIHLFPSTSTITPNTHPGATRQVTRVDLSIQPSKAVFHHRPIPGASHWPTAFWSLSQPQTQRIGVARMAEFPAVTIQPTTMASRAYSSTAISSQPPL